MYEQPQSSKGDKMCLLCTENISKYCCPRCNILYCSLDCYKSEKHMECSESFYRDCINEELAGQHSDDGSKNKMIDILKRMQQETDDDDLNDILEESGDEDIDSDDECYVDLEDRIKDLDLNDADAVWNALTEDERNEFEALINKGDITSIIPRWEPWWLYRKETKIVEEVKKDDVDEDAALKKCPLIKEVPKLSSLTSVPPSDYIKYNIVNVLASYVFVMRYFNGELESLEGATCVLSLCDNLNNNTNFEDVQIAIESVAQSCMKVDFIETDKDSIDIMRHDTVSIIQGPSKENASYYCKAALSHLYFLFFEAKQHRKQPKGEANKKNSNGFHKKFPDHGTEHLPNVDLSKTKRCLKKLEYYLSFVDSCGMLI